MINKIKKIINKRKNKKKKGFTLVELLAVIVILAVIMVITIPTVLGNMNEAKQQAFNTVGETMKKYLVDNYNNCRLGNEAIAKFDDEIFDNNCNLITDDLSSNLIKNSGYSTEDINEVIVTGSNGNYELKVIPQDGGEFSGVNDLITGEIHYTQSELMGNDPDLSTGLIPVVYDDTKGSDTHWFVADVSQKWYSYTSIEQWWANAVSVDSSTIEKRAKYVNADGTYNTGIEIATSDMLAMFVWIPRYSYTIGCTSSSCLGYKVEEASALSTSTPGAIDIKFVSVEDELEIPDMDNGIYPNYTYTSEEDRTPTNYYTHPAFWWDENGDGIRATNNSEEIAGIWVGKFETSTAVGATCYNSTSSNCAVGATEVRILPNVTSMRYQQIANQFAYSQYFSSNDNIYGLTGDAHMMKNSEWAAVAYLSQSIYGKYGNKDYSGANKEIYINNYSSYITGVSAGEPSANLSTSITCRYNVEGDNRTEGTGLCGPGASTTGNIYGIYDMNGGAYEYVMANYGTKTDEGIFNGRKGSSGINFSEIDNKYYDKFITRIPFTRKSKETIGQALYEVASWYLDSTYTFDNATVWLLRGGSYSGSSAGAFYGSANNGDSGKCNGYRSVFVLTST